MGIASWQDQPEEPLSKICQGQWDSRFIQIDFSHLPFPLVGNPCGRVGWQITNNPFHPEKTELTTTNRTSSSSPPWNTCYLCVPQSCANPWRRLDKTGAVGEMLLPGRSRLSAGRGPPYRPLRLAGDVGARAAADKWAESCRANVICGFMSNPVSLHLLGMRDLYLSSLEISVWASVFLSACVGVYPPASSSVSPLLAYNILGHLRTVLTLHSSASRGESEFHIKEIVWHFRNTHLFELNEKTDAAVVSLL